MFVYLVGSVIEVLVFKYYFIGIIKVDIFGNFGMFYCRFLIELMRI